MDCQNLELIFSWPLDPFRKKMDSFHHAYECFAHMYVYPNCISGSHHCQKKTLDLLILEERTVVSHHVDEENQILVL